MKRTRIGAVKAQGRKPRGDRIWLGLSDNTGVGGLP